MQILLPSLGLISSTMSLGLGQTGWSPGASLLVKFIISMEAQERGQFQVLESNDVFLSVSNTGFNLHSKFSIGEIFNQTVGKIFSQVLFLSFLPCLKEWSFLIPVRGCGILPSLPLVTVEPILSIPEALGMGKCGRRRKLLTGEGGGRGWNPSDPPLGGHCFLLLPIQCVQTGPLS